VKKKKHLILEFTEFNVQRLNSDTVQPAAWVMNPQLSIDAHDRHQDNIRQAISRLGSITNALGGSTMFSNMKKLVSLEEQNMGRLWVMRIINNSGGKYDVYVRFTVKDKEYWGVVEDIMGDVQFQSEVFSDPELIQTKEWAVKFRGLVIKHVRKWLMPQKGFFTLVNDGVVVYCTLTGKQMRLEKDSEIEVLKAYPDRIHVKYLGEQYVLRGDGFLYFNWWFEPVVDDQQTP
jgi:hypothetical protein